MWVWRSASEFLTSHDQWSLRANKTALNRTSAPLGNKLSGSTCDERVLGWFNSIETIHCAPTPSSLVFSSVQCEIYAPGSSVTDRSRLPRQSRYRRRLRPWAITITHFVLLITFTHTRRRLRQWILFSFARPGSHSLIVRIKDFLRILFHLTKQQRRVFSTAKSISD